MSNPLEQVAETIAASALAGLVTALQQAGASPAQSIRLAGFALLEEAFGAEKAWEVLGLPTSTVYRWRAELRKLDADLIDSVPSQDLVNLIASMATSMFGQGGRDE